MGFLECCGFTQQQEAYGECSQPKYFIYLSETIFGASNAAHKAVQATLDRQKRRGAPTPFHFPGRLQEIPYECIYRVTFAAGQPIADHGIEDPGRAMRQKLSTALLLIALRHGTPWNVVRVLFFEVPKLIWKGKRQDFEQSLQGLTEILPKSKRGVSRIVYLYEMAGFHIVKNIERDSDGQNYGTVYSMVAHLCKYRLELLRPTTA